MAAAPAAKVSHHLELWASVATGLEDDALEDEEVMHQEKADMENKLVELRKKREGTGDGESG